MSKGIKKGSQNHTEADIFSDRKNRSIINTKMEQRRKDAWRKII